MSNDIAQLIASLHPLERAVLSHLPDSDSWTPEDVAAYSGLQPSQAHTALEWLRRKLCVEFYGQPALITRVELGEKGKRYVAQKLPEIRLKTILNSSKTIFIQDLKNSEKLESEELNKTIGNLKREGLVYVNQNGGIELLQHTGWNMYQKIQTLIERLALEGSVQFGVLDHDIKLKVSELSKRRGGSKEVFVVREERENKYALSNLGRRVVEFLVNQAGQTTEEISTLTPELLKDGSWRGKSFRKYYIELKPPRITAGRQHPYRQFLDDVSTKLVSMGFEEMRGPMVESEFWNMDALFMPQFHPARDIHDVYFVKDHAPVNDIDPRLLERVAVTHEHGGRSGSVGWRYRFDRPRARQPILRSQGTAVSSRMLANRPRIPGKYFSIARCFRYDQVDATHAPDFFQVEGIVLDPSTTFRTLLGLLKLFATELAKADDIKFLPAYFPFTEPSVELHVRHPKLGWMELGGAGLFRPEVTAPMELTVPVIAWGLGLDRMAMMAMGLHDIRDLFSSDLEFLRELPAPTTP